MAIRREPGPPPPAPGLPILPVLIATLAGVLAGAALMALPLAGQTAIVAAVIGLAAGFFVGSDRARRLIERALEENE